jgi:hypothetical protein
MLLVPLPVLWLPPAWCAATLLPLALLATLLPTAWTE